MTVDVEDYFHVSAFENSISPDQWEQISPRVGQNTHKLIDIFNEKNIKATFFTLGWVAKHCPDVIKRIVDDGHELASHGSNHRRATIMTPEEFHADVAESKDRLEQIAGAAIQGYRAPSFSINTTNEWVYDILHDLNFKYSSSTYPIVHDLYGVPEWPRFAFEHHSGLLEIPIPTLSKKGRNVGIGGGGYFRLFPYWLSKRRIETYLAQEQQPYSFYIHPWEIDPNQPRVKDAPFKSKFRHYVNLSRMQNKLEHLIDDFNWTSMQEAYKPFLEGRK